MSDYMDNLYENLNEESLAAITASLGYNDGANKGFWRKQPRKKWGKGKGQWIEMGARLRALFKIQGQLKSITGRSGGSDGTPNGVRFLPDAGQEGVDSNKIYGVKTEHVEEIQATLPENYVEAQGVDTDRQQTGTGSVVSTANIPDIEDMETADVTPDDIRMIDEGVNSVEGQEAENYKNTDEGKQVASLDQEAAEGVLETPTEIQNLLDQGGQEMFRDEPSSAVPTPEDLGDIAAPKKYKGLKEIAPGVFEYKDGSDRYRMRQGKDGRWRIDSEASNSDYDFDSAADRRGAKDSWYKLDGSFDSVDDVMENFFAVEPIAPRGAKKAPEAPTSVEMDSSKLPDLDDLADDPAFAFDDYGVPEDRVLDLLDAEPAQAKDMSDAELQAVAKKMLGFARRWKLDPNGGPATQEEGWYTPLENAVNAEIEKRGIDFRPFGRFPNESETEGNLASPKTLKDFAGFDAVDRTVAGVVLNSPSHRFGNNPDPDNYGKSEMDATEAVMDKFSELETSDLPDSEMVPEFRNFVQNLDGLEEGLRSDILSSLDYYDKENKKKIAALEQADDLFQRAMNGEKVDLDNIKPINESVLDDEDDEDFDKDEPSDEDIARIADEEPDFDVEADWNDQRRTVDVVTPYDVSPGDYILTKDGRVGLVRDIEEKNDGDFRVTYVESEDGGEQSFNQPWDGSMKLVTLGVGPEPKKADTPAPAPAPTPDVTPDVTPDDDEEEVLDTPAPDTARSDYAPEDIEPGDEFYTKDGSKMLGTVVWIRKSSTQRGQWEMKIADPETGRPMSGTWPFTQGETLINKPNGEKQPEPTPEPEAVATPEPEVTPEPEAVAEPEVVAEPVAATPEDEPVVTKGEPKTKRVPGQKPKAPKKTTPEDKERPQEVPPVPNDRVDNGQMVDMPYLGGAPGGPGGPGGDGGGPNLPPRMREDKVLPQFDQFGNPLYLSDSNNQFVLDANGNPILLSDEEAFRGLIYEFYPNAVTSADGLRTILSREKDGDDIVEISVSRSNGGRSLIEVRLIDKDGNEERYIHYDVRESFAGLHGDTNSPQMIHNILFGKDIRSTGSVTTAGKTSARERLKYFRAQKRRGGKLRVLSTPEELWNHYASGEARIINKSKGGRGANKGTAYMKLRQRGLLPFWDALDEGLQTGNFDEAYFRARRFVGVMPLNLDSMVEFRNWMKKAMQERYPTMSATQASTFANTISKQMRSGIIETAARRERPFMSQDGSTPIRVGQWGYYENSDKEKSYGRIVSLENSVISNPRQSDDDFQYRDNVVIQFGDGTIVSNLAAKFFRVLDDPEQRKRQKKGESIPAGHPENGTLTPYKPGPSGEGLIRKREAEVFGIQDGVSEDEYQANIGKYGESGEDIEMPEEPTGSNAGGPVADLAEGDMFFSKSGAPLGPVFGIQPITSKSGKAGFRVAYVDENGDVQTVNVAADEVRGPKG